MTTQNSYPEHSDVDSSVVEDAPVSETTTSSSSSSVEAPVEGESRNETFAPSSAAETQPAADEQTSSTPQNEPGSAASPAEQAEASSGPDEAGTGETDDAQVAAEFAAEIVAEIGSISSDEPSEATEQAEIAFTGGIPVVEEEVRPFTEIIEEFRQAEARFSAALEEARETPATSSSVEEVFVPEFAMPWDASQMETAPTASTAVETGTAATETARAEDAPQTSTASEIPEKQETPRPVSPLLRPATRLRVPRHGTRQRDEARTANAQPAQPTPTQQPVEANAGSATPAAESAQVDQTAEVAPVEPPRPARRYRFDRPAPTTPPVAPVASASTPTVPARSENGFVNGNGHGGHNGRSQTVEREPVQQPEQNTAKAITPEAAAEKVAEPAQPVPPAQTMPTEPERRRKHGQERQRGKERGTSGASQTTPTQETPVVAQQATPTEVADVVALVNAQPTLEAPVAQSEEVAPEDLPPLEYADLQKASTRRRRRRHTNGASVASLTGNTPLPAPAAPAAPSAPAASAMPPTPTAPTALPQRPAATPPVTPATANGGQYGITSGFTVSQMNNGNDNRGPFMGPEPSPARGTIAAQSVRSIRTDAQRTPAYPVRSTEATSASVNQLANIVAQAIQTQTDRMIAELRRSNQAPTNISVSMPPFPSTERVGVFVDVANLLYSARTLRMTVDFGKLLDFLRGNRRLVRAQAYCPTSPQPGDEQMFLQAVKGLGYRITTKNYKTFSSGAKKADLDLDLCMDVVRLVDGRAVDCIVLVSGDSDFMPMLDYCSDHGVRVEVAAFDEAMSATLRQSCDLFINLSMLDEIRA